MSESERAREEEREDEKLASEGTERGTERVSRTFTVGGPRTEGKREARREGTEGRAG